MQVLVSIVHETWELLLDASIYILFGLVVGGLLKMFLSPASVARHLGHGRVTSVFKAALLGIPLPLCSCGVLPAAASLRKQGANRGATTAFLISTPESGVDSIAITYALLDPILTIARPLAAFVSAFGAGIAQNFAHDKEQEPQGTPDLSCPVDGCCSGLDCPPDEHSRHHPLGERLKKGLGYAFTDLWGDLAGWFWVGMLLAGVITALVPNDFMATYLGGGLGSMMTMLVVGIPLYICATASTPVAAALIVKGVSPGAALVFLLVGPATNITSLTVLIKVLGKRGTVIYLVSIALFAVLAGLAVDAVYVALGIQAAAVVGEASELIPYALRWVGAVVLIGLSIRPISKWVRAKLTRSQEHAHDDCCGGACASESKAVHEEPKATSNAVHKEPKAASCGCSGGSCGTPLLRLQPGEITRVNKPTQPLDATKISSCGCSGGCGSESKHEH